LTDLLGPLDRLARRVRVYCNPLVCDAQPGGSGDSAAEGSDVRVLPAAKNQPLEAGRALPGTRGDSILR
jgi:hypothetical protein